MPLVSIHWDLWGVIQLYVHHKNVQVSRRRKHCTSSCWSLAQSRERQDSQSLFSSLLRKSLTVNSLGTCESLSGHLEMVGSYNKHTESQRLQFDFWDRCCIFKSTHTAAFKGKENKTRRRESKLGAGLASVSNRKAAESESFLFLLSVVLSVERCWVRRKKASSRSVWAT